MEKTENIKMEGKLTIIVGELQNLSTAHHRVFGSERRNPNYIVRLFGITMSPIQNSEQHFRRLLEPDLSIKTRIEILVEVKDSLEMTNTPENLNFLECCFQASTVILHQITKPQFKDNLENKLRNIVLEILYLLSRSEVLLPFDKDLLKVAIQVLTTDNEENGVMCTHIILRLLVRVGVSLENEVQPFLDFVCKIYQNFRLIVGHFLEKISTPSDQLNPTTCSLKIVAESPLVESLMKIFLLHSRLVHTNIPKLLPLMVDALSIRGPKKVSSDMKPKFIELNGAQVKTVLFLTFSLKALSAEYIKPRKEIIYKSIVHLLVTCSDSESIRMMQRLLASLEHILGTDWSSRFKTKKMIKILVEDSLRDKKKILEKEAELLRVKTECESLRSSEARLVSKSTKLEGEKTQKEVEIQKLMEEIVKLTDLLDKKEAQILALNEQCKIMALNASNV